MFGGEVSWTTSRENVWLEFRWSTKHFATIHTILVSLEIIQTFT